MPSPLAQCAARLRPYIGQLTAPPAAAARARTAPPQTSARATIAHSAGGEYRASHLRRVPSAHPSGADPLWLPCTGSSLPKKPKPNAVLSRQEAASPAPLRAGHDHGTEEPPASAVSRGSADRSRDASPTRKTVVRSARSHRERGSQAAPLYSRHAAAACPAPPCRHLLSRRLRRLRVRNFRRACRRTTRSSSNTTRRLGRPLSARRVCDGLEHAVRPCLGEQRTSQRERVCSCSKTERSLSRPIVEVLSGSQTATRYAALPAAAPQRFAQVQ
jgi:hypothetical protein